MKTNIDKIEDILTYSFGGYPYSPEEKEIMDTFDELTKPYWQKGEPDCDGKYLLHYEDGTEEIAIRKHGCFYVLEETHRFGYSRIFAENGNDGGFGVITDRKHIKINELVVAWHKIPLYKEEL